MVAGLSLQKELGYRRGAQIRVTDPVDPMQAAWEFVVANDEHTTLTCRAPAPPSWIRPGVRIRIEVVPPVVTASERPPRETVPTRDVPRERTQSAASWQPHACISRNHETRLFDAYMMIDWGSKSGRYPDGDRADAPWLAEARWEVDGWLRAEPESWFATRRNLLDHARRRLVDHVEHGRRVLIGFDFAYGYPAGFGAALGFEGPSYWRSIWNELRHPTPIHPEGPAPRNAYATDNNKNNRFEIAAHLNQRVSAGVPGPLYGCPQRHVSEHFGQATPAFPFGATSPLARYRIVERRLLQAGLTPLPCWWVLGGRAPTVGGQILTGLPGVHELRYDPLLEDVSCIWPFEGGFSGDPKPVTGPRITHVEIWPGLVAERTKELMRGDPNLVRDQAQVRSMVEWAALSDAQELLRARFDVPSGLAPGERSQCETEEGWILGA